MAEFAESKRGIFFLEILTALALASAAVASIWYFDVRKNMLIVLSLPFAYFFLASRSKVRLLLYFVIALIPILMFQLPPRRYGYSLYDLLIVVLVVVALVYHFTRAAPLRNDKTIVTMPMIGIFASCVIATILSEDPFISFADMMRNFKFFFFYWIFISHVKEAKDLRIASYLLLVGLIGCSMLAMAQAVFKIDFEMQPSDHTMVNTQFKSEGETYVRASATFPESITFAQYLLIPLFMALGLASYLKNMVYRLVCWMIVGLGGIALVVTLSRGAIGAFGLVCGLWVLLRFRLVTIGVFCGLLAVMAGVIIAYPELVQIYVPSFILNRFKSAGHDFFYGRQLVWTASFAICADFPFFGVGLRNLLHVLPLYAPSILADPFYSLASGSDSEDTLDLGHVHVDSVYLTFLTEIGLVGLAFIFYLVGRALLQAFRNFQLAKDSEMKGLAFGVFAGFLAYSINIMTTYGYSDDRCALMFWIGLALIVSFQKIIETKSGAAVGNKATERFSTARAPVKREYTPAAIS